MKKGAFMPSGILPGSEHEALKWLMMAIKHKKLKVMKKKRPFPFKGIPDFQSVSINLLTFDSVFFNKRGTIPVVDAKAICAIVAVQNQQ